MQLRAIKRLDQGEEPQPKVRLTFSNGNSVEEEFELSLENLRKNCPCAECRERKGDLNHSRPLTSKPINLKSKKLLKIVESDLPTQIELRSISQVGNYALSFAWADGHDSGIYTFDYLYSLCTAAN